MSDTRTQFEVFISGYASIGAFDLTVCKKFPEQYEDMEIQMLYDAFTAGAQSARLAAPAPEPVAWVTKAALRHWAEHKGEGPQEYTFLPRALNDWDLQEDLQVALYAAAPQGEGK